MIRPIIESVIQMKYRRRPVVIEAEQITWGKKLPEGVWQDDEGLYIDTLEGRMRCQNGDWIITGVRGERYACRADIFEETYESADAVDLDTPNGRAAYTYSTVNPGALGKYGAQVLTQDVPDLVAEVRRLRAALGHES